MVTENFWKNKKVLVTGASGFIGNNLVSSLINKGARVVAVAFKNQNSINTVSPQLTVEVCDLTDWAKVISLFQKNLDLDAVFHLAASAIVSQAAVNPVPTVHNNVVATLNILEACRVSEIKRLLLASSDKAYGDHTDAENEKIPYQESYALRGMDIYSASKVCADVLAHAYAFQFKMPIAVARACNVFGPGDTNFTRLIPRTIMRLLLGRPPIIKLGHENVLREYVYIDDLVAAYLFLAENLLDYFGENCLNMPVKGRQTYGWAAFNIGSYNKRQISQIDLCPNIKSVKEVIDLLRKEVNNIEPQIVEKPAKYIEIPDEYSDSSKIIKLGFRTKFTFKQGVELVIPWYKENFQILKDKALEADKNV